MGLGSKQAGSRAYNFGVLGMIGTGHTRLAFSAKASQFAVLRLLKLQVLPS